jgi:hypothetical protein
MYVIFSSNWDWKRNMACKPHRLGKRNEAPGRRDQKATGMGVAMVFMPMILKAPTASASRGG